MEDVLTGWQPDPFGVHEKRFFSSGGLPTKLVSDGDVRSYDNPPSAAPLSPEPAYQPRTMEQPEPVRRPEIRQPAPGYQPEPAYQPAPGYQSEPASGGAIQATRVRPETPRKNGTTGTGRPPDQLAPQPARLALLCANCGQRHNAVDGVCPQCGEEASSPRPPAESLASEHNANPAPTLAVPAVQREETFPPPIGRAPVIAPPPPILPAPPRTPAPSPAQAMAPPMAPTVAPGVAPAVAPAVAAPQSINPFAIASLVLGLVGVPIAGSILAIVFGVVARRQIRETPGGRGGNVMATWGIVLGCLGLLGAIIGAVILLGGSHGRSPDAGADVTTTSAARTTFVRSPEKSAFGTASTSLAAANNTFARELVSDTGNSVSVIAQSVTPYTTALTTFNYQLRQVSWSSNVQIQIETLELRTQALIKYLSTVSSVTSATSNPWLTHLRTLGTAGQSADNAVAVIVGVAKTNQFPDTL
jgi:hypothetical protein